MAPGRNLHTTDTDSFYDDNDDDDDVDDYDNNDDDDDEVYLNKSQRGVS
jgi:hypothetical protein